MTDQTIKLTAENRSLHFAFAAGCEWAASLKPGDVFRGSHGEARHRGLGENHTRFFGTGGQVGLVDKQIFVSDDNTITSIKSR